MLEVVSGTVLGFLLFLIFINDLPKKCSQKDESFIMLLADDTKTYQGGFGHDSTVNTLRINRNYRAGWTKLRNGPVTGGWK